MLLRYFIAGARKADAAPRGAVALPKRTSTVRALGEVADEAAGGRNLVPEVVDDDRLDHPGRDLLLRASAAHAAAAVLSQWGARLVATTARQVRTLVYFATGRRVLGLTSFVAPPPYHCVDRRGDHFAVRWFS